jgi:hypothetical protein
MAKSNFNKKLEKTASTAKISDIEVIAESVSPTPGVETEKTIPISQVEDYINKKFQEMQANAIQNNVAPKTTPANKKVEAEDDLPEFANWETRDRIYVLCTGYNSLSHGIKDRHKRNSPLMYKGRALRYSTSQASFFMDKQQGDVLISYLSIENGNLFVPKENEHLQKFLAIHPDNGIIWKEFNPKDESKKAFDIQNTKLDAHFLSRQIDTATLEAVAMLMCKDYIESWDIYTIKRQIYNEIEANPNLFIKLANDKSLKLKAIGKIAVYRGLLNFRDYRFYDEGNNVVCESNRNEDEYEALAAHFSTNNGRSVYEYLKAKIEN